MPEETLDELKEMLDDVSNQMQELREELRRTSYQNQMLSVPEPYEHPWWKYQRQGFKSRRNSEKLGKNYTIKEEDPTLD